MRDGSAQLHEQAAALDTTIMLVDSAQMVGAVVTHLVDKLLVALVPVAQAIIDYLDRPDVQDRIHKAAQTLQAMHQRVKAIDAPGYVPYFEKLGHDGFSARFYAALIRYQAKRLYQEDQDRRVALMALHRLAKRSHWDPVLAPQIMCLRDHCWEAIFLDKAFHAAGCPERKREFLDLLQSVCGGDLPRGPRLMEIITLVAPFAPSAKGRPMSFDSALHQAFLRTSAQTGGRQGYTYGPVHDGDKAVSDFIDDATRATRIELKCTSFSPVAARRAVRSRLARDREVERTSHAR